MTISFLLLVLKNLFFFLFQRGLETWVSNFLCKLSHVSNFYFKNYSSSWKMILTFSICLRYSIFFVSKFINYKYKATHFCVGSDPLLRLYAFPTPAIVPGSRFTLCLTQYKYRTGRIIIVCF